MPSPRRLIAPALTAATLSLSLWIGQVHAAPVDTATARELAYSREVAWSVDGIPEIAVMEATVRSILDRVHVSYPGVDGQPVEGFYPGASYQYFDKPSWTPFYLYGRDTATILPMARYFYGAPALRSAVEEFLRLQYSDGSISATISPKYEVDKATVVSDEESSIVLAAVEAFDALPDQAWLRAGIRGVPLVERLNRAMDWLLRARLDPTSGLIIRAHTTDWGDVKWKASTNPTDMEPGDQWTASIYDQAIAYGALQGLARLNEQASRPADAQRWRDRAQELRDATNAALWQDQPDRGFYRIHIHLQPDTIDHPFDEGQIVSIGNAAAIFYGLADASRVGPILEALERARVEAEAPKVGMVLDPPYAGWQQVQMDQRIYQNGAIWDWWGGRQITAEFRSGYSQLARDHLIAVAQDWATHPGKVNEWESPWKNRTGGDDGYAGAAAVMGQAVLEGLFGVDISAPEVRLTPRLGPNSGTVRAYEPSTDLYVAYQYQPTPGHTQMVYGSNSPTALSVRLEVLWSGDVVALLDGTDRLPVTVEPIGNDRFAHVTVPSGTHRIDVAPTLPVALDSR